MSIKGVHGIFYNSEKDKWYIIGWGMSIPLTEKD